MAGILLSGWRIRLFDSAGNPLYPGKVEFYDSTTSLPKTIYADKDLTTPLGTFVTSDLEGYLPAIWLSDGYYKAQVSQLIQADPETWKPLWNINHLGKDLTNTGGAGTGVLVYCENIGEMKQLVAGSADAVICAGYYESGDCGEPLFFTWKASSTKTDDAGAYIRGNDTPAGTAGRYHQQFESGVLDIRRWGGIPNDTNIDCTGALVNMGNYACDFELFPEAPPVIGFIETGVYYFSGNISFNRIWSNALGISIPVPYYIGQACRIQSTSRGTFTISNPTTIESDENIYEYPTSLVIDAESMNYVRPQWMANFNGNLANKIFHALSYGLPVRVWGKDANGEVEVNANVEWNGNTLSFESPDIYFTLADEATANIIITCPITVSDNHYIFRMPTLISDQEIHAGWYGYGYLSGTDQGPALQSALNGSNGQAIVRIPRLQNSTHNINSAVDGYAHSSPHTIKVENGYLVLGSSAVLKNVYLDAPLNTQVFYSDINAYIKLTNNIISPYWFGAKEGSIYATSNNTALLKTMNAGAVGRNVVDGCGSIFYISNGIIGDYTSDTTGRILVSWKNITLEATSSYNFTTYPSMISIHGGIDCEFESVNINTSYQENISSMYINTYWSRVRNCFFGNDVVFGSNCEDYAFTNNQIYGEVTGSIFASPAIGGIITGNTFTQCRVQLLGDAGVQSGYYYPMLQQIIFTNNTLNNLDGSRFKGCLYIISRAVNTLINGLIITNNSFGGNIPEWSNNGETGEEVYRYRILDVVWDAGSWAVSTQPATDVRHLMRICDNTFQWYLPAVDAPTPEYPLNKAGHRTNYLPRTHGLISDTITISPSTYVGESNGLKRYNGTSIWDRRDIFVLSGDTTTQINYAAYLNGWREKVGATTWNAKASCIGGISFLKSTPSGGSYVIDLSTDQYFDANSYTWDGSVIYYGINFEIYEEQ